MPPFELLRFCERPWPDLDSPLSQPSSSVPLERSDDVPGGISLEARPHERERTRLVCHYIRDLGSNDTFLGLETSSVVDHPLSIHRSWFPSQTLQNDTFPRALSGIKS